MKGRPPIGVIRLLAPILGRARRRWRLGPLVPMVWRRRQGARVAPAPRAATPPAVAPTHILNLKLVWPAGTAARVETVRHFVTTRHRILRAGLDAGARGTSRLVALVERLWLRSDPNCPPGAAVSPDPVAPTPAWTLETQDAPRAWPRHEGSQAPGWSSAPPDAAARALAGATIPSERERRFVRPREGAAALRSEARTAKPVAGPGRDAAVPFAMRTTAATSWRRAGVRSESPAAGDGQPKRRHAFLVWRKEEAAGNGADAGGTFSPSETRRAAGAERVWRRPAAASDPRAPAASSGATAAASWHGDGHARADRPAQPVARFSPAAPAVPAGVGALQPAEMRRLVDEVVRRLDRIGRDERMRRGI